MISRVSLKEEAKKIAWVNKMKIWQPVLIYMGVLILISILFGRATDEDGNNPIISLITLLLSFLTVGYLRYLMAIVRGEEFSIKDILSSKVVFVSALILSLLISIYVILWMLLLIIPGFIAALSYSMSFYLMADDYTITPSNAIKTSKKIMDGYKMDYFIFNLSFIPWILLVVITFGIASIWVVPYISIADVLYYEKLKEIKGLI